MYLNSDQIFNATRQLSHIEAAPGVPKIEVFQYIVWESLFSIQWASLETPKRVTDKQSRPRSDAAEYGIWWVSPLFPNRFAIFLLGTSKSYSPTYQKLKLDSSNIQCWGSLFNLKWVRKSKVYNQEQTLLYGQTSRQTCIYYYLLQKAHWSELRLLWGFVCVEFYGPVNPLGSYWAWSVYLTPLLLGRLSLCS